MPSACIDIGSNTTRLLVAEMTDGRLEVLRTRRAFTKLGADLRRCGGVVSEEKLQELAGVVKEQVAEARELGADALRVVATAAVRRAENVDELCAAVRAASGLPVEVLSSDEEARLGFLGAVQALEEPVAGRLAVVDVGGGSTEISVGVMVGAAGVVHEAPEVEWSHSFAIGSSYVTDSFLNDDPPTAEQLAAARAAVTEAFASSEAPAIDAAVAIGGSASSLRQVVGPVADNESLQRAVTELTGDTAAAVADELDLNADRVRMLPASMMILNEIATHLAAPIQIGTAGLREGVVIQLLAH